jgi:hypothetical protein
VTVDGLGALAPFANRPHDLGLSAPRIPAGKNVLMARAIVLVAGGNDSASVELQIQFGDVHTDFHPWLDAHALRLHLLQTPIQDPLIEAKVWDAIAQQSADLLCGLVDGDLMSGPGEMLRAGQTVDHADQVTVRARN